MNENNPQPANQLRNTLLQRIEQEKLQPRSRLFFNGRECMVWALWLLSIVIGALAVAISVFVVMHHQYALYEATHRNLFTFMVDILPVVWLLVFVGMAYFALYNLRHTRYGYRYSVTTILASSIVLSFALGSALQYFGMGYTVDSLLGQQMGMYISQEKFEQALWQQPAAGRLIGLQVYATVEPEKFVVFEDIAGERWRLNVVELVPGDRVLLAGDNQVRVLGAVTDAQAKLFHACGVFSWMFNENLTRSDRSSGRDTFIRMMSQFRTQAQQRIAKLEAQTVIAVSANDAPPMSVCANMAIAH